MCEILNEYKRDEGSFLEMFEEFSKVVDVEEVNYREPKEFAASCS